MTPTRSTANISASHDALWLSVTEVFIPRFRRGPRTRYSMFIVLALQDNSKKTISTIPEVGNE